MRAAFVRPFARSAAAAKYLSLLVATAVGYGLTVHMIGCEPSRTPSQLKGDPSRVVIHYVPFFCSYVDGIRINSCDMLVKCGPAVAKDWTRADGTYVCDSIELEDTQIISSLWGLSGDTGSLKKAEGLLHNVRICVVFLGRQGQVMRRIALSFHPIMEVDGTLYRRDVRLFDAVKDLLPGDYLRKPVTGLWSWGVGGDFFYDAETHWFKSPNGEFLEAGGCGVVLRSALTGNPADTGYCFKQPVEMITGNPNDTGFFYVDIESNLYREPAETLFRSR